MELPDISIDPRVQDLIGRELAEDCGERGDVTSLALVPEQTAVAARVLAREACVVSGCSVAAAVFRRVHPDLQCEVRLDDGERARADDVILTVQGNARAILTAERTALNFMQRMSGIATLTRRFVDAVAAHEVMILDTRKTTPTLRPLEKYAVRCGGGYNHRMGLYDRVLIKDNHRKLWSRDHAGRLDLAVQAARKQYPGLEIEVEVENEIELQSALQAAPEWILLDNMTPAQLARCVGQAAGRSKLEASGGVALETVAAVAASGVDAISLGCLTHSARAVDLSLEFC